ncbi:hypothetical protein J437_LFUL009947 [Ladona fulva]|uniref:Lipase n=1 Tax=Ladona fulva TaxID=123851 RepID=A0A8K0KDM3_LADFU|nr:hypothetical protein J437_LFUL009947 [Ladona fulva]
MAVSIEKIFPLLCCLLAVKITLAAVPFDDFAELRMRAHLRDENNPEADLLVVSKSLINKTLNVCPPILNMVSFQPDIVKRHGYPIEIHQVTTEDGYILTMHRIPHGKEANSTMREAKKPVIFLQHCLLCSSAVWVIMGTEDGLAYILADAGFDVWMGNARGNVYSREHVSLHPSKNAFWDFTWHDMGLYDIPAEIDHILENTGENQLFYVGHSMGTTVFFAMASMLPEYNTKIKAMHALAPVAFNGKMKSPVRLLAPLLGNAEWLANLMGLGEFLPSSAFLQFMGKEACNDEVPTQDVCSNVLFLLSGYDIDQLNTTTLPTIIGHLPAGTSTKTVIHYAQGVNSGEFRMFDYGLIGNLKLYGQVKPPHYNLEEITAPVALHYSTNDWLADVEDVSKLAAQLPNKIGMFRVPYDRFSHLDYLFAIDIRDLVYNKVLSLLRRDI